MTFTETIHFEIPVEKLQIPLSEFIIRLKKRDDLFGNYGISYTLIKDQKQRPQKIRVILECKKKYLFPLWNLFSFFNKYVSIETDFTEFIVE